MPLSIRDLSTPLFCLAMIGCQSLPYDQTAMQQPQVPIQSPTDTGNAVDPVDDSPTVIYLKKAESEPATVKTHIFRWPFTNECGSSCGTMWALSAIAVGITISIITNHHKKGCVAKVVACATWPNCTYPPPPPGCTYDFGG